MWHLIDLYETLLYRANLHNHPFHDKKILQKIEKKSVFSALDDVVAAKEKEDNEKGSDADVSMEHQAFASIDFADEMTDDNVKKRMEL